MDSSLGSSETKGRSCIRCGLILSLVQFCFPLFCDTAVRDIDYRTKEI